MSNPNESSLIERIEALENVLYNLKLMYKPPGGEHQNITEYLDTVEERLNALSSRQGLS